LRNTEAALAQSAILAYAPSAEKQTMLPPA